MLAAAFWSLLTPAIELCREQGSPPWAVAAAGVLTGLLLLLFTERIAGKIRSQVTEDPSFLLWLSVTLHNVPEGLAVGVAFGTLNDSSPLSAFAAAFSVALGIGIQNIPEGTAVSLPMRRNGHSPKKAFLWGVLSGAVEPIAALAGAMLVVISSAILPFALCLAAGAMLYVTAGELLPQTSASDSKEGAVWAILGFVLMMVLDLSLG